MKTPKANKNADRVIDIEPKPEPATATQEPTRELIVAGFGKMTLWADEEPRALDLDLGEKLGYVAPRHFRDLVKRLVKRGFLKGVSQRRATRRYESKPGVWQEREEEEYHLTEVQFVMATTQAGTETARDLTEKVARFFVEARNGLRPVAQAPANDNGADMKLLASSVAQLTQAMAMLVSMQMQSQQPQGPQLPTTQPKPVQLVPKTEAYAQMKPEKLDAQQELIPKKWHWMGDVMKMTRLTAEQVADICYALRLYVNNPHTRRMSSTKNPTNKSWQYDDYAVDMIREMAIRKGLYR